MNIPAIYPLLLPQVILLNYNKQLHRTSAAIASSIIAILTIFSMLAGISAC
jgi:hypothetical protein